METIKRKSGNRFREVIWLNGKRIKSPLFRRKTDAQNWRAAQLTKRNQGRLGIESLSSLDNKTTFGEYCKGWLSNARTRLQPSSMVEYERKLNTYFLPLFGHKLMRDFVKADADLLLRELQKRSLSPKGINDTLQLFKGIFIEAESSDVIIRNPFKGVKSIKVLPSRIEPLSSSEVRSLLIVAKNTKWYMPILVALRTGMRRGELAGLQFNDIDFDRGLLQIRSIRDRYGFKNSTKSGKSRLIPITDEVKGILIKLYHLYGGAGFVFRDTNGNPINFHHAYRGFQDLVRKAGLKKNYRFHDLRHTFATDFMRSGGSIFELQKILGHARVEMTSDVYVHFTPKHFSRTVHNMEKIDVGDEGIFESTPDSTPYSQLGKNSLRILNS